MAPGGGGGGGERRWGPKNNALKLLTQRMTKRNKILASQLDTRRSQPPQAFDRTRIRGLAGPLAPP